ncbi:hypothetical protein N7457_007074, partial [Penicillium paradoxum]|uniref:uncharacterized protein n=1 Tax=Penicillium paradoxum TaxID=176176 RepID=UPI002547DD7C
VYCHLCGVSFNIARRRKPGEPDLASWDYTGRQCDEPGLDELELEDCAKNGCCAAVRHPKDSDDTTQDPDYIPQEESSDIEPYEYDSDYESTEAMSLDGEQDVSDEEQSMESDDEYYNWLSRSVDTHTTFRGEPVGKFAYTNTNPRNDLLIPITSDELPEGYDLEELEHIPGPTCAEANAYSGYVISLEEMRGCRTAQFLVHKDAAVGGWTPDGLNEPWEISEDWFLSGVCDGMTSRDMGGGKVWPARGGVDQPRSDNVNFDPEWTPSNDLAMPFHPWCFDIFCRQSKSRFKHVNVSGLMKWRNAEFDWDGFQEFPRTGDVFGGQEQFWRHEPKSEYLAANPLSIPNLPTLLLAAVKPEDVNEDVNEDDGHASHRENSELFQFRKNKCAPSTGGTDVLASLPLEIRLLILGFLDPVDIARSRTASRAFTQLPNSFWYRQVRKEMPWLWEACDETDPLHIPSPWTKLSANEVAFLNESREHYSRVLRDEEMSSDNIVDHLLPLPSAVPDQVNLPRESTDWHQVYTQIKYNWDGLKGLRNRQRIWEDIEEVFRRIEKYDS